MTIAQEQHKQALIKWIWLYIGLWIFEGALRKWIVPGLSTPLLLVREPVLLMVYALAFSKGLIKWDWLLNIALILAGACVISSIMVQTNSLFITAYGFRSNFMHLPLIFIMAKAMDLDDVIKLGKYILICSIPMAILFALQFAAPREHFLNWSPGGGGWALMTSNNRARVSGTFSFVSGTGGWCCLVCALVLAGFSKKNSFPSRLHVISLGAVLLSVVVSGSRGVVLNVGVIFVCAVLFGLLNVTVIPRLLGLGVMMLIAIIGLWLFVPAFSQGVDTMYARFTEPGDIKIHVVDRAVTQFTHPVHLWMTQKSLLGEGLGTGTNVAMQYGSFGMAESEWHRNINESGLILGLLFIIMRIALVAQLFITGLKALKKNNPFPAMLASASPVEIMMGQWGQGTAMGYSMIIAGLCLASANMPAQTEAEAAQGGKTKRRGRSVGAENLLKGVVTVKPEIFP